MANQWNQNQYGNQGGNYPPQQQYNNQQQPQYNQQQQYNPQQNNNYPQQQYNQQPQYNNNPQQNYPQQQYNQQPQQQYNQQPQYNQQQGGNWNPPPNQQNNQNPNNNRNNNEQTWTNKPKVKVTQKGNMTITETTESGGGKGRSAVEYGGPPQLGPGRVTSSGPYQPQTDEEQKDYFRLKLWESSCCCGCGNTDHPCLNLWIWSIWWLIIFIFNGLINLIASLAYTSYGNAGTYAIISILIIIVSICINCFAMYALFKLIPVAFLLQLIAFVVFFILVTVGLFIYPFSVGYLIMSLLFIVCDVWAFIVFWRVYAWARHFKSGGNYDPNMQKPPR